MNGIEKYPPLKFAKAVSGRANAAWEDGSFIESVTPTTRMLLTYWFDPAYTELRDVNFHQGQRQAILNIIYIHEVLKKNRVIEAYEEIAPQLLLERGSGMEHLSDAIYSYPKYAVKMATGTGKTWVLEALVVWQYLNAKHQEDGNYTKNFLVIAPGLIVYDRLLDAFQGRNQDNGETRDFDTCDLKQNQELFIPEEYREEVFGFLQSSVVAKTDIGSAVTGDGLVAITNYHLLMGADDEDNASGEMDSWSLPVTPGTTAGHGLEDLDHSLNGKRELEFLRGLPNLMMINDEAHHIHNDKKHGEVTEVEWQKSLRYIASTKGTNCIQLDFSATPYTQRGKEKIYFPHIVVDFELKAAVQSGLVKTIVLDERKELNTEELDFKAVRDGKGRPIDLSDGQRQMLRAGLAKLDLLENELKDITPDKIPKLLVMCEDTEVVPFVKQFLLSEGLDDDDILEIHSNKKGEVGQEEWEAMKQKLFALDKYRKPRIVISVLMLREGFDVNNVCVIVPLRSSTSGILLEQTIGRGLRLMWRGDKEIDELKAENRHRIMVEKKAATNYFDVLSIVEHPAFRDFYQSLIDEGVVGEDPGPDNPPKPKGDLITVGLKPDYEKYDFRIPIIVTEAEEVMGTPAMDVSKLKYFRIPLSSLQKFVPDNEKWISTEITEDVHFGDFDVINGIFRATSYNDYLMRIVNRITEKLDAKVDSVSKHKRGNYFPALSINNAQIAGIIDQYIRTKLFNQTIDPNSADVWKVLRIKEVIDHIISQVSGLIVDAQGQAKTSGESDVRFNALSSVSRITVRENYQIELTKCIYERMSYPSNKGQYEKDFMEYCDRDGQVDALCKIIEQRHTFARFRYVREDGLPAEYIPDFLVRFGDDIYIVETKAQDQLSAENVKRKQRAALRWIERINSLPAEKRENKTWHYSIVGHATFYDWKNKHMEVREILDYAELRDTMTNTLGRLI